MKKLCALVSIALVVTTLLSCSNVSETYTITEQKAMKISDFKHYGDIHNEVLNIFHSTYNPNECDLNDINNVRTYLSSFYAGQINDILSNKGTVNYSVDEMQKSLGTVTFPFVAVKSSANTRNVNNSLTDEKIDTMLNDSIILIRDINDVLCLASYAYRHNMIDLESYKFFSQLLELIDKGMNDSIGRTDVKNDLKLMSKTVDNNAALKKDSSIMITGPIMSISNSSCEYWTSVMNEEYIPDDVAYTEDADTIIKRNLPPFVYADAGGAALGAIVNAYQQYKKYGKVTSYGNIGKAALGDAITSSLGADMFFGKFLINGTIRLMKPCGDAFWKIVFKLF